MARARKYVGIAVITVILSSCAGGASSSAQKSFISGNGSVTFIQKAERIKAPSLAGMTLSGTDYLHESGKVTVVNVWASWCAPCRAEIPTLISLSKKYSEVVFIGILTRDNLATAEAFQRRFAIPYPTLIDDSLLIGFKGSLPANAIPSTVVIDRTGRVAGRISGQVTYASLSKLIERVNSE